MPAPAQPHPLKVSSTQLTLIVKSSVPSTQRVKSKPVVPSKLAAKPQSKPVSTTAKPVTKATKSIKPHRQIIHSRSPSPTDIKPVLQKTDEESKEEQYDEDSVDEDKEDSDVEDAVEGEEGVISGKDKVTTGINQEMTMSSLPSIVAIILMYAAAMVEDMIFDALEHEGPYVASLSLLFASVMPYLYSERLISPAELPAVTWLEQVYKSFSSFFMPQVNTDEAFALFGNREFGLRKMIEAV
ncbi:hypothetical protein IW261DRAFT_1571787 [Armillaria novae-zelandiae]|uniref:Uncharacterized protein n=1 Tax=Armillaria novae-zelandiae TaxID=153914 RepID=A0AA39NTS3_9AGAR|nr:hypothetical protein IW261DRAFT_1571787 [Armillaria novae-zelandiae]